MKVFAKVCFILHSLLFVIFIQETLAQYISIPCVILIDNKLPGNYIENAYFEYQDSTKRCFRIPIDEIYSGQIILIDSNMRKLKQLKLEDVFTRIALNFSFKECTLFPHYEERNILNYFCTFNLEELLESMDNVITFYNIDKEDGTYFYYYYMGSAIGRSNNASPYIEDKNRVFYNY